MAALHLHLQFGPCKVPRAYRMNHMFLRLRLQWPPSIPSFEFYPAGVLPGGVLPNIFAWLLAGISQTARFNSHWITRAFNPLLLIHTRAQCRCSLAGCLSHRSSSDIWAAFQRYNHESPAHPLTALKISSGQLQFPFKLEPQTTTDSKHPSTPFKLHCTGITLDPPYYCMLARVS